MKKQILISSLIAAGILGGTGIVVLNNVSAEGKTEKTENAPLVATTSSLTTSKPINTTKNETVYVMTDESGSAKAKFIGSTIYDGTETLPFNFTVTYYLDGQEISAKDLKGKSGHVKIVYHYDSTATYQSKKIPFLAITGLTLDHSKFSNVKISNGKIVSESSDNYIIAGYGLAGVNQDLGTDFLPDSFTIEADTTNFSLENTYTIFTNDILADLDTSKLNRLDELTSSVYQLEDGINKLVNGATDLSSGLAAALNGTKQLYDGSKTLAAGAKDAATGAKKLSDGLGLITSNNDTIQYGASTVVDTILEKANQGLALLRRIGVSLDYDEITVNNYEEVYNALMGNIETHRARIAAYVNSLGLTDATIIQLVSGTFSSAVESIASVKSLIDLNLGVISYTNGVAEVATGANDLSEGLSKLSTGANTLSAGLGSLVEGETKLYEGSVTLKDGLSTFKTAGIDKLVNFASRDLANFTRNARTTVNAAASYHSFGNADATSVKFIVKTPSI